MSLKVVGIGCTVTLLDLETLENAVVTIGQDIGLTRQSPPSETHDPQTPMIHITSWEEYHRYQHWAEKVKEKGDDRLELSPLQYLLLTKTIGSIIRIGKVRYKVIEING